MEPAAVHQSGLSTAPFVRKKKKKNLFFIFMQVCRLIRFSYSVPRCLLPTVLQVQITHQFLWPNTTCTTKVKRKLTNLNITLILFHFYVQYILYKGFASVHLLCSLFHFWAEAELQRDAWRLLQSRNLICNKRNKASQSDRWRKRKEENLLQLPGYSWFQHHGRIHYASSPRSQLCSYHAVKYNELMDTA